MRDTIQQLLATRNIHSHDNKGILYCQVPDHEEGAEIAKSILYSVVTQKTALYLSGGSTPQYLYATLAEEEQLIPGVVGLIDERYGIPMHAKSNERMILETGLLRYLSMRDIQYYPMLKGLPIGETADRYDELIRSLQTVYPQSVGVLGIGNDGHTAGIAPNRNGDPDFKNRIFNKESDFTMVNWFDDTEGPFGKRVTMTFLGLSMLDLSLILVFGEEKKQALEKMFADGSEVEIPARFFTRPEIAQKTVIITDLHI